LRQSAIQPVSLNPVIVGSKAFDPLPFAPAAAMRAIRG
jgi:hypothetical protein